MGLYLHFLNTFLSLVKAGFKREISYIGEC